MMPKQNDQQRLLVSQTRAYVVQKGDSLWAIGRKFGIDWRVIVRNNRIIRKLLQPYGWTVPKNVAGGQAIAVYRLQTL